MTLAAAIPGGVGRTASLNARHSPAATIIVCYQALPYITDRPSLQRASVVVLVDPPGKPPLCPAVWITLHRLRHSDVAPAGGAYKPRAATTWAGSARGLVLRSAHYERIFLNAFHIPLLFHPPHPLTPHHHRHQQHVALISKGFLWRAVCKVRS